MRRTQHAHLSIRLSLFLLPTHPFRSSLCSSLAHSSHPFAPILRTLRSTGQPINTYKQPINCSSHLEEHRTGEGADRHGGEEEHDWFPPFSIRGSVGALFVRIIHRANDDIADPNPKHLHGCGDAICRPDPLLVTIVPLHKEL